MIDALFELSVVGWALCRSNFAKLPLMMVGNVIVFNAVAMYVESSWDTSFTPGYEIYHMTTGLFFLFAAVLFFFVRNNFFKAVSLCLLIQAFGSCLMLFDDSFKLWHELINEGMRTISLILVWVSSEGVTCKRIK